MGEGGSIPLMGLLSNIWPKAQFVITGVLGPNSNAHGPNEFLDIEFTKKLTQAMAHVLAKAHRANKNWIWFNIYLYIYQFNTKNIKSL